MVGRIGFLAFLFLLSACASLQGSLNGKLSVGVSGLPPGFEAEVVVRGGQVERILRASAVLELPEGEYRVEAREVRGPQGEVYAVSVQGSPAKVEYGKTAEVRVEYAVRQETLPASLTVVVRGLPSGVDGRVTVYGPGGTTWNLTASTTLRGLKAGVYAVVAEPVAVRERTYTPRVEPASLTLPGGGNATVQVEYVPPDTGYLAVAVEGLPSGAEARVKVRRGGGVVASLSGPEVLELPVGTCLVVAEDVVHSGQVYRGAVSGSPAEVRKGNTALVRVVYAAVPTTGELAVTVNGLPQGVGAHVEVVGPRGFRRNLTASATLRNLEPGTYTVTARDVTTPRGVYRASVQGSPAEVVAGTTAEVEVSYQLDPATVPGDLLVRVEGLPPGVMGSVRVQGPGGFDQTVGQTTFFPSLAPGFYTASAEEVSHAGRVYRATVSGSPVRVGGGGTATIQVAYALYSAFLTVQIHGLPAPVANVVVTGPMGYVRNLSATAVLTVEPGVYAVSAYPVVVDGVSYVPTVQGSPVSLEPGANGSVRVTYQAAQ